MSDLSNYSIETDQVVLLSFKDGRNLRVPLKHISRYIKGGDLDKIKKSVNLRRHFLHIHMPRLFVVLAAAGGLVALLSLGGKAVAGLFGHPGAPTMSHHTGIARSRLESTPQLSPNVNPAQSDSRLASTARHNSKARSHLAAHTALAPAKPAPADVQATAELTSQTVVNPAAPVQTSAPVQQPPVAIPSPSPTPTPSPSASPTPAPQVLGDATGPTGPSATQ